jgi:nitroreductase
MFQGVVNYPQEAFMEFLRLIEERHSMRSYTPALVEEQKLQTILAAANRAPSAGNKQGYEIYVVRSREQRQALVKAAGDQEFLAEAPLVLIFCANPTRLVEWYQKRGTTLYAIQDATIACTFAMLAASDLGLCTVWVGAFDEQSVRKVANIPSELRPVAMLPIGVAGDTPRITPRRELNDLTHEA